LSWVKNKYERLEAAVFQQIAADFDREHYGCFRFKFFP